MELTLIEATLISLFILALMLCVLCIAAGVQHLVKYILDKNTHSYMDYKAMRAAENDEYLKQFTRGEKDEKRL